MAAGQTRQLNPDYLEQAQPTMSNRTKGIIAIVAGAFMSALFVILRPTTAEPESSTPAVRVQPENKDKPIAKGSADAEKRRYRPDPVTRAVAQTVEAIIRRHQGMTKAELQKSAELNKLPRTSR